MLIYLKQLVRGKPSVEVGITGTVTSEELRRR